MKEHHADEVSRQRQFPETFKREAVERLRDNMGNRLSPPEQKATGSRMILSCEGSDHLLGCGHLGATSTWQANPARENFFIAQVPFASAMQFKRLAEAAISHQTQS